MFILCKPDKSCSITFRQRGSIIQDQYKKLFKLNMELQMLKIRPKVKQTSMLALASPKTGRIRFKTSCRFEPA